MSTECDKGVRPVPERGTDSTVLPLLTSVRLPLTVPADPGLNTIGTFTLCAGLRSIGVVTPAENPDPAIVSCVIVTTIVPVFVIFTVCVTVVLTACNPKPSVLGVAERLADPGTGVGLAPGVGLGVGELFTVLAPLPQPIVLKMEIVTARKRPKWMAGFVLLRTVTPH